MSITVGDIKKGVLHEMREFSNSGQIQGTDEIKDYLLSIIPLLNVYQKELAVSTQKIKRKYEISHNMPDNQLGKIIWNEDLAHSNSDVSYSALGSRAYSFQVAKYATVYIEEEIAGVWTNLVTITHTPTAGDGYVTYKGLTGVSSTLNLVRIRFSGTYRYPYRWIALFADNFYDASEVPAFEPYVPYSLPVGFYMKDRVQWSHADRQLGDYSAYKMDETTAIKKMLINWYDKGEFTIYYYAYPTVIADPDPNNTTALDSTMLDVADECLPTLVHRIAGTLLRDENPYISDTLSQDSQIAKAELVQNDNFDYGGQGIVLNSNW
jgi:hypothetical protein